MHQKSSLFLNDLKTALTEEKLNCSVVGEHLLVYIGHDSKGREQALHIHAVEQIMEKSLTKNPHSTYFLIQFRYQFPFKIEPSTALEVSSLLLFLNHLMELPGLELSELEEAIFYRYVLFYGEKRIHTDMFLAIIGVIGLILELFTESIEKVATGELTFNDLLEKVLEISKQFKTQIVPKA